MLLLAVPFSPKWTYQPHHQWERASHTQVTITYSPRLFCASIRRKDNPASAKKDQPYICPHSTQSPYSCTVRKIKCLQVWSTILQLPTGIIGFFFRRASPSPASELPPEQLTLTAGNCRLGPRRLSPSLRFDLKGRVAKAPARGLGSAAVLFPQPSLRLH